MKIPAIWIVYALMAAALAWQLHAKAPNRRQ